MKVFTVDHWCCRYEKVQNVLSFKTVFTGTLTEISRERCIASSPFSALMFIACSGVNFTSAGLTVSLLIAITVNQNGHLMADTSVRFIDTAVGVAYHFQVVSNPIIYLTFPFISLAT